MAQIINIQVRRDTAANWSTTGTTTNGNAGNPILNSGEFGFETDTGKFKLGDGTNTWNLLTSYYTKTGIPLGAASLDSSGKVPVTQLPASVLGALNYQGTYNAATNTPALVSSSTTKGYYWKTATAGTSLGYTWNIGDLVVDNGSTLDKIDGIASEVVTVAGRTGAVTLAATDISGLATSATTDTTNAANIGSGTLVVARLPALTGDVTSLAGTGAFVLTASGATAGTYTNATVTVDAKGRVTSATAGTPLTSINGGTA